MPQASLGRVPNGPTGAANNKARAWLPKWMTTGGIAPQVPGELLPSVVTAPVVTATSLSVAGAGVASVTNGTWTNSPTGYTYQWHRAGANIAGATNSSYTFVVADEANLINCAVTPTNAAGTGTPAMSNSIGPIVA